MPTAAPEPKASTTLIAIAPNRLAGKPCEADLAKLLPQEMLCTVVPIGGGEFKLRPIMHEWVQFSERTLAALNLGSQYQTLRRLGRAGFIRFRKISPNVLQVHLPSLMDHLAAMEADPDFWDSEAEMDRWRKAYK